MFYSPEDGFQVEYGRGLVMAFVAVVLVGAALRLAVVPEPGRPAPGRRPGDGADRPGRPGGDDGPAAPADLTVAPTVPFARPDSDA